MYLVTFHQWPIAAHLQLQLKLALTETIANLTLKISTEHWEACAPKKLTMWHRMKESFLLYQGDAGPVKTDQVYSIYGAVILLSLLPGFAGSLLDWQGALSGLFSFTALYEITEPHCAATTVVQSFWRGKRKGKRLQWRVAPDHHPVPTSQHTH